MNDRLPSKATVFFCLLGGALLTAISSWALRIASPPGDRIRTPSTAFSVLSHDGRNPPIISVVTQKSPGVLTTTAFSGQFGDRWGKISVEPNLSNPTLLKIRSIRATPTRNIGSVTDIESGFPLRAMTHSLEVDAFNFLATGPTTVVRINSIRVWVPSWFAANSRGPVPYDLPLRPLPLGFAINTLFYATLVFFTFETLGWARRARRRTRGLCARCAHSLQGLPEAAPCPECGRAPRVTTPPKA